MRKKIIDFVKHPTSVDVIINTLGSWLNIVFTAIFALILVRLLNPSQYGVLSVLLGIAYVLANILDFGTTATIYSYLPPLLEKRTRRLYVFIKTTFTYQSILSLSVIAVLLLTFPWLDKVFFKTYAPRSELYLTIFSALFFIWQNFVSNMLLAAKKVFKMNLYLNLANILKTILIFALAFTQTITVGTVIFVFGIIGPALFFFLLFWEKRDFIFVLIKSEVRREEFRMGYTMTYFIATQFFNLGLRMDLFLLSFFGLRNQVGYYGLSQKIILSIVATIVSVTQILSPNFSRIKNRREAAAYFKTALLYLSLPVVLFAALLITPQQLFDLFFTTKFLLTAAITKELAVPYILYTLGNLPLLFILYAFKKPIYVLYSNILFFLGMTIGNYLLIPKLGAFAPAYVIGLSLIPPIIIQAIASYYGYKKLPA